MSRWREKKVDEDAATLTLGEDFEHARPMWNAEVAFILRNYLDQQAAASASSPSSSLPPTQLAIVQETLSYTSSLNLYPNPDAVNTAHELLNANADWLSEWELATINNCKIDEVEEAVSLLPTLRGKLERGEIDKDRVEELLTALKRYQLQQ